MDPQLQQLAQLLGQTVSPDQQAVKGATAQLKAAEPTPGFGTMLLTVLQQVPQPEVQQAGAIYLKNYVRRNWDIAADQGGVAASDRTTIKTHLLTMMLASARPVQVQLSAAVALVAKADFPA